MNKYTRLSFFSALFAILIATLFTACGSVPGTGSISIGSVNKPTSPTASKSNKIVKATASSTSTQTTHAAAGSVPLKVIGVDMTVNPPSFRNAVCGTHIEENYVATFHFPARNRGGFVQFEYTEDNKQAFMPEQVDVRPGQTSATYTFSWIGFIEMQAPGNPPPGRGGVVVTFPNTYTSALVTPSGPCTPAPATPATLHAPFKVNDVSFKAGTTVTGHRCGTSFTESYTATFGIPAGSPGGTIVFQYATNNASSSSPNVSLHVAAGQTTATYVFKWSGVLSQSHTVPGAVAVKVSAPNQLLSISSPPVGSCSNR